MKDISNSKTNSEQEHIITPLSNTALKNTSIGFAVYADGKVEPVMTNNYNSIDHFIGLGGNFHRFFSPPKDNKQNIIMTSVGVRL